MQIDWENYSHLSPNDAASLFKEKVKDLNVTEQIKLFRLIERSIYENSLYDFAHYLGYNRFSWDVHSSTIQVLESSARRKLIVLPRNCYKSTLASVIYPMWRHFKNPDLRIIIDSELLTNSSKFLREIEGHLLSEKVTRLWGNMKQAGRVWNSTELTTSLRKDLTKKEASFTVSGIGAQKTSQHYDIASLDDISTPANIRTPELREKVISHYRYYQSLLDPYVGEMIVIGTRYHEGDLIGWIIENELDEGQRKALGF